MIEGILGVIVIIFIYTTVIGCFVLGINALFEVASPTMKSSSETLYRIRKKKYHWLFG